MSSESISEWLQSLSLSDYEELLQKQGFTSLHQLSGLTQDRLREIGVVKLGHIKRILKNIPQAVNGEEVTQPSGELVSSGEEQPRPVKKHANGEEQEEAPPPTVPPCQRRSSSGLSDAETHNEALAGGSESIISPPAMSPLCEDSQFNVRRRPPTVPRRQQSLQDTRRGTCEAEDVPTRQRHSSGERRSYRMSLPPDSITSIPGLSGAKSPPPVPLRRSSLTPSPDLTMTPPSPPGHGEPLSDQEDEKDTSAVGPFVDQRLLADGPPSFSPPPPPAPLEEEHEAEMKPPTTYPPSYVNVEMLTQVSSSSPTPLPRKTISQKHPIAAPRRKKPSAPSDQPSDPKPADPTSNAEDLAPPGYSIVQRRQLKRADAMQDEFVSPTNTAQPAVDPRQLHTDVEYEDMDSHAGDVYEQVDAPPPQSRNLPTQPNAVPPPSHAPPPDAQATPPDAQATPPLPAGISSAYSMVEFSRDSVLISTPSSGEPALQISPPTPPTTARPQVCMYICVQICCSFSFLLSLLPHLVGCGTVSIQLYIGFLLV